MESANCLAEQVDEVDAKVFHTNLISVIQKLVDNVDEFDKLVKCVPKEAKDDPAVNKGLEYLTIVKESLSSFASFLSSPLGATATTVVWKHLSEFKNFFEIATGVVIATFFVVIAQELLEVKEDEFKALKNTIEISINFVRTKLEAIESHERLAAEKLKIIGEKKYQNESELEIVLWSFGEAVREAKLNIDECEQELNIANKIIDEALKVLTARLWINGAVRGGVVTLGWFGIYLLVKKKMLNPYLGFTLGIASSAVILSVKVPRNRKLHDDFLRYKTIQENLQRAVIRMKNRLESHESSYLSIVSTQNNI